MNDNPVFLKIFKIIFPIIKKFQLPFVSFLAHQLINQLPCAIMIALSFELTKLMHPIHRPECESEIFPI